jgi:Holliday junction resolvase RusA-like endonuclease
MSSETIRLYLPPYPCQRAQVANGHAYYKEAYRVWMADAVKDFKRQWRGRNKINRLDKLSMQFYGWSRAYDLSNLFKSAEDAAVKSEVLKNDNLTVIQHIESAWEKAPAKDEQYIDVYLEY